MNPDAVNTPAQAPITLPQMHPESPTASSLTPGPLPPSSESGELAQAGYGHSATVWISPRLLRCIVPVAVVAIFVFLFLPWTGAYPSGYPAFTQNAFQTIWGGVSIDPLVTESLNTAKPYDKVEKDPFMLLYVLAIMLALVLVLTPLVFSASRVQTFRPIVQSVWQRREGLLRMTALAGVVRDFDDSAMDGFRL